MAPDRSLVERLARHGQDSLLRWWDDLGPAAQAALVSEINSIDLDQVDTLIAQMVKADQPASIPPEQVEPIEVFRLPKTDGERVARRHVAEIGDNALAAGEVGVVIVAGVRGPGSDSRAPRERMPSDPSQAQACSRSTLKRSSRWAAVTASHYRSTS